MSLSLFLNVTLKDINNSSTLEIDVKAVLVEEKSISYYLLQLVLAVDANLNPPGQWLWWYPRKRNRLLPFSANILLLIRATPSNQSRDIINGSLSHTVSALKHFTNLFTTGPVFVALA